MRRGRRRQAPRRPPDAWCEPDRVGRAEHQRLPHVDRQHRGRAHGEHREDEPARNRARHPRRVESRTGSRRRPSPSTTATTASAASESASSPAPCARRGTTAPASSAEAQANAARPDDLHHGRRGCRATREGSDAHGQQRRKTRPSDAHAQAVATRVRPAVRHTHVPGSILPRTESGTRQAATRARAAAEHQACCRWGTGRRPRRPARRARTQSRRRVQAEAQLARLSSARADAPTAAEGRLRGESSGRRRRRLTRGSLAATRPSHR